MGPVGAGGYRNPALDIRLGHVACLSQWHGRGCEVAELEEPSCVPSTSLPRSQSIQKRGLSFRLEAPVSGTVPSLGLESTLFSPSQRPPLHPPAPGPPTLCSAPRLHGCSSPRHTVEISEATPTLKPPSRTSRRSLQEKWNSSPGPLLGATKLFPAFLLSATFAGICLLGVLSLPQTCFPPPPSLCLDCSPHIRPLLQASVHTEPPQRGPP